MDRIKNARPMPNTAPEHPRGPTIGNRLAFLSPKNAPLFPLFGMLAVAAGLAGMTMARHAIVSPDVLVDKDKRANVPEIEQPEVVLHQSTVYKETSPLRSLSKNEGIFQSLSGIQQQPPILPGDDRAAVGVQGNEVIQGKPAGGI